MKEYRILILLTLFLLPFLTGAWSPPEDSKLKWTKETWDSGYTEYNSTVTIPVKHTGGNVQSYQLTLVNNGEELMIYEVDERYGFSVSDGHGSSLEVDKSETGDVTSYTVNVGSYIYSDLDGDGSLDGYHNRDESTTWILVDQIFIKVNNSKDGFKSKRKWSLDGTRTNYVFEDGRWSSTPEEK